MKLCPQTPWPWVRSLRGRCLPLPDFEKSHSAYLYEMARATRILGQEVQNMIFNCLLVHNGIGLGNVAELAIFDQLESLLLLA